MQDSFFGGLHSQRASTSPHRGPPQTTTSDPRLFHLPLSDKNVVRWKWTKREQNILLYLLFVNVYPLIKVTSLWSCVADDSQILQPQHTDESTVMNRVTVCASALTGSQWIHPGYHCQWDHLLLLSHHSGLSGLPSGISPFFTLITSINCHSSLLRTRSQSSLAFREATGSKWVSLWHGGIK